VMGERHGPVAAGRRQAVPRIKVKDGELEDKGKLGSRAVTCHRGDGDGATWLWRRRFNS
jgi:hypothetical protein